MWSTIFFFFMTRSSRWWKKNNWISLYSVFLAINYRCIYTYFSPVKCSVREFEIQKNRTYELSSNIERQTDRRCITAIASIYLCVFFSRSKSFSSVDDSCCCIVCSCYVYVFFSCSIHVFQYCLRWNDLKRCGASKRLPFSRVLSNKQKIVEWIRRN